MAVALEVFALNYGKHQMIGANSSVEINSRKLGESGIERILYLFIDWHNDRWQNGCFTDLTFFFSWDLLISAVAGSSWFIPPIDHLFLSIIVIMDNFFRRLECWKALKPQLFDVLMISRGLYFLEDCVGNTKLSSKYNNHITIMTYFRTNTKNITSRMCYS